MKPVANEVISQQLGWRYATKQFDPSKKISDADWATLEESLILSPSSFGLQPWKFFVVKDTAIREKLLPVSWNQPQIVSASHLVVLAIKKNIDEKHISDFIGRIAEVRGVSPDSLEQYKGMMTGSITPGKMDVNVWASKQVYIALGFFLTTAAMMGIDACPMEGFDPVQYDKILNLESQGYHAAVLVTAGYRDAGDKYANAKKVRAEKAQVLASL